MIGQGATRSAGVKTLCSIWAFFPCPLASIFEYPFRKQSNSTITSKTYA